MSLFSHIRKSGQPIPLSKAILHTAIITCLGLMTGALIKLLDIYTTNLGNIFSQVSVWIFLCTLISVYSNSAIRAAVNVFGFLHGNVINLLHNSRNDGKRLFTHLCLWVDDIRFIFSAYGILRLVLEREKLGFKDNLYWNYYSNACGFNRTV